MARSRGIAVFDVGKSSLKLVVCSAASGRIERTESIANTVAAGPPYPHFDVDRIWEWLLRKLAAAAGAFDIEAIIPVTHGATAALLAADGLALPVLDYEHAAPQTEGADYRAVRPPFARTFSPDLPCGLNLGRQIWWQARRFPEPFARVDRILLYPQYWCWRLSGVMASEVTSIGCHTDLWCPGDGALSPLPAQRGWTRLFPAFRKAGDELGPVLPEVAQRTSLSASTRVLNGLHDSNASYYRHLAHYGQRPFSVLSTGTWVVAMGGSKPLAALDETRDCLANVDVNGTPVPCARFMGGREFEALLANAPESGAPGAASRSARPGEPDTPSECDAVLRKLIERGTFALPSFAPSSGPFAERRGAVVGPVPASHLEAAALAALYLALMSDVCLELIGSEGDIHIEGRLAGNAGFVSALAALRPRQRVFVTDDATGTAAGAAALALRTAPSTHGSRAARPGDLPGLRSYSEQWRRQASIR